MSKKRHTPEHIINKLRQAEAEPTNGAAVAQVALERWRRHYNSGILDSSGDAAQLAELATAGPGGSHVGRRS